MYWKTILSLNASLWLLLLGVGDCAAKAPNPAAGVPGLNVSVAGTPSPATAGQVSNVTALEGGITWATEAPDPDLEAAPLPTMEFGEKENGDFVVTEQGDTLYGKVRHGISHYLGRRTIKISGAGGTRKLQLREYKAYRRKGKKYMKIRVETKKGRVLDLHSSVVVDGKLTLLLEIEREGFNYFLYYEGVFYEIFRKYFPNEIWQKLILCPAFADKYGNYHQETGGKVILYPKDPKTWQEIVKYYNGHCPE